MHFCPSSTVFRKLFHVARSMYAYRGVQFSCYGLVAQNLRSTHLAMHHMTVSKRSLYLSLVTEIPAMISHISIVSSSVRLKIAVEGWRRFNESMPFLDLYEKINSLEFSLKTMCAVNVVHRIIDSVGVKKNDQNIDQEMLEFIQTEASKRVEKLNLPSLLKELLSELIKPIYNELDSLYNYYQFDVSPVWSPHGTIDLLRSSRTVVEDPSLTKCYRFIVASAFCHERQIFELAQQMTDEEMAVIVGLPDPYVLYRRRIRLPEFVTFYELSPGIRVWKLWHPIAQFWLGVLQGGGFDLTQEMCEKGLVIALKADNDAAAVYFLGKGDPEGIRMVLSDRIIVEGLLSHPFMSPATYCLLFSKISGSDLRTTYFNDFALILLRSLISWPYQPLFLDVARSLCIHVSERTFSKLLIKIIDRGSRGYKDFHYRGLFVGFYETIVSLNPDWRMAMHGVKEIVLFVLQTEDELWIKFVFGKLSEREKEFLLLDDHCIICAWLTGSQTSHLLELFVRLCSANRIDLLLKVKDTFQLPVYLMLRTEHGGSAVHNRQRLFSQILDKMVAEQEPTDGRTISGSVVGEVDDELRTNST